MTRAVLAAAALAFAVACGEGGEIPSLTGEDEVAPNLSLGECGQVQETEDLGADHLSPGQTAAYPTYPPASGPHDARPLPAGVYPKPLPVEPAGAPGPSLFRAVHSLEHGYVLIVYRGLSRSARDELEDTFRGERKVIVAPAGEPISGQVAAVAWRHVMSCASLDLEALQAFVDKHREAVAPEPGAP